MYVYTICSDKQMWVAAVPVGVTGKQLNSTFNCRDTTAYKVQFDGPPMMMMIVMMIVMMMIVMMIVMMMIVMIMIVARIVILSMLHDFNYYCITININIDLLLL